MDLTDVTKPHLGVKKEHFPQDRISKVGPEEFAPVAPRCETVVERGLHLEVPMLPKGREH